MLILFNKYVNTIIYLFIYIVATWLVVVLPPFMWWIPDGWWCIPGGWCCCPSWWLVDVSPWLVVPPGILARIFTAEHPGGYARHSSVRRALAVEIQVSKE